MLICLRILIEFTKKFLLITFNKKAFKLQFLAESGFLNSNKKLAQKEPE